MSKEFIPETKIHFFLFQTLAYLAMVFGLKAEESHDAHMPDGGKVVEHRDGKKYHQLVAPPGPQHQQHVVKIHLVSNRAVTRQRGDPW